MKHKTTRKARGRKVTRAVRMPPVDEAGGRSLRQEREAVVEIVVKRQ